MKRIKYFALGIALTLIAVFSIQFVSAGGQQVDDQTLKQEEVEALRSENEQIDEVARELDQENRKLEQANNDLYGQLIIYRDQVNQMKANQEREYYTEGN